MSKNQVVCLTKTGEEGSQSLHNVYMGANWGAIKVYRESKSGFLSRLFGKTSSKELVDIIDVDLDASILIYDRQCNLIDVVYYGQKLSKCKSISHSGDDLTGDREEEDEIDNETISINLDQVNKNAEYLVAILNSYRHHTFDEIPYIGLRIYTGKAGEPDEVLASYKLDNNPEFNGKEAIVLGAFYRNGSGWKFKADGRCSREKSIKDMSRNSALSLVKELSNDK